MNTASHGVIDLLVQQHRYIEALFDRLQSGREPEQQLFEELVRQFAVHESAEQLIVHPATRRLEFGQQIVGHRLQEEAEAEHALARLAGLGVEHPDFPAALAELAEEVKNHAEREEHDEFPLLAEHYGPDYLSWAARAVRAAEAVAPTRAHELSAETRVGTVLVGGPQAVFDRARDAVRHWLSTADGETANTTTTEPHRRGEGESHV